MRKAGRGRNKGLAFCSPYEGTVRIYQWDPTTSRADLWLELPLTRNTDPVAAPEDQYIPASGAISNGAEATVAMPSEFFGGYAEADVPIHCVINSQRNETKTFKGTSGEAVSGIYTLNDEQATTGVTPEELRVEVKRDAATGLLLKKTIANGTQSWVVA